MKFKEEKKPCIDPQTGQRSPITNILMNRLLLCIKFFLVFVCVVGHFFDEGSMFVHIIVTGTFTRTVKKTSSTPQKRSILGITIGQLTTSPIFLLNMNYAVYLDFSLYNSLVQRTETFLEFVFILCN